MATPRPLPKPLDVPSAAQIAAAAPALEEGAGADLAPLPAPEVLEQADVMQIDTQAMAIEEAVRSAPTLAALDAIVKLHAGLLERIGRNLPDIASRLDRTFSERAHALTDGLAAVEPVRAEVRAKFVVLAHAAWQPEPGRRESLRANTVISPKPHELETMIRQGVKMRPAKPSDEGRQDDEE